MGGRTSYGFDTVQPGPMPTGWESANGMAPGGTASKAAGREPPSVARPGSGTADDAELLHAGLESRSLEAQDPGGAAVPADPPPGLLERRDDVLALDVLEAPQRPPRAATGRRRQEVGKLEPALGGENHGPLDDVLQLAYVPGPAVGGQPVQDVRTQGAHGLPHLRRVEHGEMPGETRDILPPLSQGREIDREDVEAVVKVRAEAPLAHGPLESAIRGRDQPHVHRQRLRPADALELALLQNAQELRLQLQRQVADLVEEERPPVGELEPAHLPRERAGERPLLVPEELALDHAGREGGAVHLHQDRVLPPAQPMDRADDQLLAGARLPRDQHRGVGRR